MQKYLQWASSDRLIKVIISIAILYAPAKALEEFVIACPCSGPWLSKLTTDWAIVLLALTCLFLFLDFVSLSAMWLPLRTKPHIQNLINQRKNMRTWFWAAGAGALLIPGFLIYSTEFGSLYKNSPYIRLTILLLSALVFGFSYTKNETKPVELSTFLLGALIVASLNLCLNHFQVINSYPFSFTWSEGNRLYDYSVFFGSDRYVYPEKLTIPYNSPGRHILWGIIYLVPHSPIWLHRLWNALLWIIPPLGTGFVLTHRQNIPGLPRAIFILWCCLFLSQGPIYAPLLLGALLVFSFRNPKRIWLIILAASIATYYVAISRVTWVAAPVTWAIIILADSLEFSKVNTKISYIRILISIVLFLVAGYIIAITANPGLRNPIELIKSITFEQPLLWYRLLPNATLPEGILLSALINTGPILFLLLWIVTTGVWKTSWIQRIIYAGSLLLFLALGIVASVKIGGGSNLHNLDMYLITIVLLTSLSLPYLMRIKQVNQKNWLAYLACIIILIPAWNAIKEGQPLSIPEKKNIAETLAYINEKIPKRLEKGEILFIDQRQLLTFGYIKNVPLVPEYEKKYLMDKAMAGDQEYFITFYNDLSNKRFSMIITNPIYNNIQDDDYRFDEENNAWVKWIARPLLCYYAPVKTNGSIGIQVLFPRLKQPECGY